MVFINTHLIVVGFALLEAMLAVAIFALGVLALGRCISQGMAAEWLQAEDARASRALENRAAEIEVGAVPLDDTKTQIEGGNGGMVLTQTHEPVRKHDEQGRDISEVFLVTLETSWSSDGERQSRTLNFYVRSRKP